MADLEMICNLKACRKVLKRVAWVTSCLHAFCDEDGLKELQDLQECRCPVCGATLSRSKDIVRADLNPPEHFKSMVLLGLSPNIIIEIITHAFSFWTYQTNLSRKYQEILVMNYKEKLSILESSYESLMAKIRQEVSMLKKKVKELEKEKQAFQERLDESHEKLAEKSRENQKLHNLCNSIRKANFQSIVENSSQPNGAENNAFSIKPKTMQDVMPRTMPAQSPRRNMEFPGYFTPKTATRHAATAMRRTEPSGFNFNPFSQNVNGEDAFTGFAPFPVAKTPRVG